MRNKAVTTYHVEDAMRLRGLSRPDEVSGATLERNGSISLHAGTISTAPPGAQAELQG